MVPEIWIEVAKKTKIRRLSLTTRDIPDYHQLMRQRLRILREHRIKLRAIQKVIAGVRPLTGARHFLDKLRAKRQVIILSDTYYEFAMPLMRQLGYPTLFCNRLETNRQGFISAYRLRQENGKEKAVRGLRGLGFSVRAAGDSYNDITMLKAADKGVLFNPPARIARKYPRFKVTKNYPELFRALSA